MKYPSVFHLISAIRQDKRISCILIGGFAVNHYGVTRQTADVDFLITEADFKKIAASMYKAGYKQDYSQEAFIQLKGGRLHLMDVDFMFADKETLDGIKKEAKSISIAGKNFLVPSLEHLIALKLHSVKYNPGIRKARDLPDIINLIRANKLDFKKKKYHDLSLKYGTRSIYKEVLKQL